MATEYKNQFERSVVLPFVSENAAIMFGAFIAPTHRKFVIMGNVHRNKLYDYVYRTYTFQIRTRSVKFANKIVFGKTVRHVDGFYCIFGKPFSFTTMLNKQGLVNDPNKSTLESYSCSIDTMKKIIASKINPFGIRICRFVQMAYGSNLGWHVNHLITGFLHTFSKNITSRSIKNLFVENCSQKQNRTRASWRITSCIAYNFVYT